MTKLQSLFYSLICNIVIVLVIDSISSVIGIDSSCLSLIMDLIPIILYVLSLGLLLFLYFLFCTFFLPLIHPNQTNDTQSRQNRGGGIPLLSTMQVLVISYYRLVSFLLFGSFLVLLD